MLPNVDVVFLPVTRLVAFVALVPGLRAPLATLTPAVSAVAAGRALRPPIVLSSLDGNSASKDALLMHVLDRRLGIMVVFKLLHNNQNNTTYDESKLRLDSHVLDMAEGAELVTQFGLTDVEG